MSGDKNLEGAKPDASKPSSPWPARWEKTKAFIIKNYLPLAFLVALGLALAWPVPGRFLANVSILGNVRVCQVAPMILVFFITGLQLNTTELKRVLQLRNMVLVVYGFVAILIITPCLGFALRAAPLDPWEFATGLAIFCVAPTTLGVGVALTEACGGNRALALLLTVGTNALAVFTMPPELQLLLPSGHGGGDTGNGVVSDDPSSLNMNVQITDLLIKLAITVLVPFTIGKFVREVWPAAAKFAKEHRIALSLTSTTSLAFVVWQTLSAARDLLLAQRAGPVFAMIGLAIAMHVAYLLGNYLVVRYILRAPLREGIAVVIMASQKSAPVAVTTITFMTTNAAQQGLLSLPSIVGQMCQIFIGAAIAKYLSKVVDRAEKREKEAAEAAAEAKRAAEAASAASNAEVGEAGGAAATDGIAGTAAAGSGTAAAAAGQIQLASATELGKVPAATTPKKGLPEVASAAVADVEQSSLDLVDDDGGAGAGAGKGASAAGASASRPDAAASNDRLDDVDGVISAAEQRPLYSSPSARGPASLEARATSGRLAAGGGGDSGSPTGGPVAALPPPPQLQLQLQPVQRIPGQPSPPVL